jgi:hypothetical protein
VRPIERKRGRTDLILARHEPFSGPLRGPDRLEIRSNRAAEERERRIFFQPRVQVVAVPRRKQAPETTFGLEEVHQVVIEVVRDPGTIDVAMERADIHNVVAHQDIGAGAGRASVDAKG